MKTHVNLNDPKILRITLFAGLFLFLLAGIILTVFYITEKNSSKLSREQDNFIRILREYDVKASDFFGTEREYDYLNAELDRLEKRAIGVESWLSILKRRRALAFRNRSSLSNYQTSINNALKAYPSSQPIIAVAASALVKDSAINNENEIRLRQWMSFITDSKLNNLKLYFHILLGDFHNVETANLNLQNIESDGSQSISVNLAVLKTFRSDIRGASADLQLLLNSANVQILSPNTLRFAAEYHYDFGDLIRSAEIFSSLNDKDTLNRQADALYLAGFKDSAISIWKIITQTENSQNETALYNLSLIALQDQNEKEAVNLFKLLNDLPLNDIDQSKASRRFLRQFGLIYYSRFFNTNDAFSLLRNNKFLTVAQYPYIDLEICKRLSNEWVLGRRIAETWMLLDRHNENEDLYQWAAWHFFFQRNYDEIPVFLDRLNKLQLNTAWVKTYNAIYLLNNGNLQKAEEILLSIIEQNKDSEEVDASVYVNLGRIYEELRSPSRALLQYETAVKVSNTNKTSSHIYQRMARCLVSLNRPNDAIRALLDALDLDPNNISARMELDRFIY
ncbi:MAG: hypothetical protein FWB86_02410 [Treponema sp.]|nr:hypothetical protein [Treponema sp.]MCL2251014.1 hypothetical protein [Treponema sp.]